MGEYLMYRHMFDSDEEFWAEKRRIDAEVRAEMSAQLRKDLPFLIAPFLLLFVMIIVGAATASP